MAAALGARTVFAIYYLAAVQAFFCVSGFRHGMFRAQLLLYFRQIKGILEFSYRAIKDSTHNADKKHVN